jgi:stage II sporulation protein D
MVFPVIEFLLLSDTMLTKMIQTGRNYMFFDTVKKVFVFLIAGCLIAAATACSPARRPGPDETKTRVEEGEEELEKPPIPEAISRGEGKEPVLKVYDVKSKEIKELPIEQYLEGVVAGEMKNDWPDAALEAQAMIARTFVLKFIQDKKGSKYEGAHVSTDIEEAQAWNAEAVNDKVKTAINKTRGMVMVYEGEYPNAWFHAHAGGITASAKEGLNYDEEEPPYIQVKKSPDSPKAPKEDREWTARFSKAELLDALKKAGKEPDAIRQIKIGKKGPSGRAVTLLVNDVEVSTPELRIALGSTEMKSTLLSDLGVEGDTIWMKGKGYGHGVGMSQWGAYGMAEEGKSAVDIIKYYFKDIRLVRLWD